MTNRFLKVFNLWEIYRLNIIGRVGKNSIADWVWMWMLKWHVMSNSPLLWKKPANTFHSFSSPRFGCLKVCTHVYICKGLTLRCEYVRSFVEVEWFFWCFRNWFHEYVTYIIPSTWVLRVSASHQETFILLL